MILPSSSKNSKKSLISTVLWLFYSLSLKNDWSTSTDPYNFGPPGSASGSVPKCHGSTTLVSEILSTLPWALVGSNSSSGMIWFCLRTRYRYLHIILIRVSDFGYGSALNWVLDPDSGPHLNADPDTAGQKWPAKNIKRNEISFFEVLDVLFGGAEGFSCSLGILYKGLVNCNVLFFPFLVIKTLSPELDPQFFCSPVRLDPSGILGCEILRCGIRNFEKGQLNTESLAVLWIRVHWTRIRIRIQHLKWIRIRF